MEQTMPESTTWLEEDAQVPGQQRQTIKDSGFKLILVKSWRFPKQALRVVRTMRSGSQNTGCLTAQRDNTSLSRIRLGRDLYFSPGNVNISSE